MKRQAIMLLPLLVALLPTTGSGSAANRAGVVIRYSDGTVRSSCVSFNESSISGLELLQRADAEVIAQPAPGNAAVCKIGADGCDYPAEPCFCKFGAGNNGEYWAYWQLDGGAWRYGQQGAGARRVADGDVDGWAYGSGTEEGGVQPPVLTFAEVCPLASPSLASAPQGRQAAASLEAATAPAAQAAAPSDATSPAGATDAAASPSFGPASTPPSPQAAGAVAASTPSARGPAGGWGSYAVFGAMLVGVLAAAAVALRRRGAG